MLSKEQCYGLGVLTNNVEAMRELKHAIDGFRDAIYMRLAIEKDQAEMYRHQGRLDMLKQIEMLPDIVEGKRKEK